MKTKLNKDSEKIFELAKQNVELLKENELLKSEMEACVGLVIGFIMGKVF
jgi:hypothetical protein